MALDIKTHRLYIPAMRAAGFTVLFLDRSALPNTRVRWHSSDRVIGFVKLLHSVQRRLHR
jgi:hypothetical protein